MWELVKEVDTLSILYSWWFLIFFLRFFLFTKDTERQRHRQREKQAPCREPDMGLDPGSPGSGPGPKAGAKPLSHPGIPDTGFNINWGLISRFQFLSWTLSKPLNYPEFEFLRVKKGKGKQVKEKHKNNTATQGNQRIDVAMHPKAFCKSGELYEC